MSQRRRTVAHLELKLREILEESGVIGLEGVSKTIARPRFPVESIHHATTQQIQCPLPSGQDFAFLERQVLKVTSQRRQDLDMAGSPSADPLRLPHVNLATRPIDVFPRLVQDLFGSKTREPTEREIRSQATFAVSSFETRAHLVRRQNFGVHMLKMRLLKSSHRISRDQFEEVLAKVEEATSDPPMIVDRDGRQPLGQRSQPDVEFSMTDAVDRVFSESGDKTIEHYPDLKDRQARLLVSGDPQRYTFSNRDFPASRFVPLSFSAEKTFPLERDDIRERRCLIGEISTDAFRAGRRRGDGDHEWSSGLADFDDLGAAHDSGRYWSLLLAQSQCFCVLWRFFLYLSKMVLPKLL